MFTGNIETLEWDLLVRKVECCSFAQQQDRQRPLLVRGKKNKKYILVWEKINKHYFKEYSLLQVCKSHLILIHNEIKVLTKYNHFLTVCGFHLSF